VVEFGGWHDATDDTHPGQSTDGADASQANDSESDSQLGFGILRCEPDEQIDAIAEQIESLRTSDVRVGEANSPHLDFSDIDFSLPDDKWPEVEVVLRDAPPALAGEFREEEILSDPFQSVGYGSGWSIQTDAYFGSAGRGPVRFAVNATATAADLEPLSSVPLMLQVETELYSPDPVLPEETCGEVAIALTADVLHHAEDSGTSGRPPGAMGKHQRQDLREPPPADANPPAPKRSIPRPAKRKFATLFTSLQG
jgi:hypothetical protein